MIHFIIGTGGQGRVIADTLRAANAGEPVFIEEEEVARRYASGDVVYIGIGDNFARGRVARSLAAQIPGLKFGVAVHPAAVIARDASLGAGTVVMAGAIVNTTATIGEHVILNTNSSVDHDCVIGNFASIAPRVALGGNVKVGEFSAVGIGASVSHGLVIGEHTVVGAGSVVVKALPAYAVCYGVPAKMVRTREAGEIYL